MRLPLLLLSLWLFLPGTLMGQNNPLLRVTTREEGLYFLSYKEIRNQLRLDADHFRDLCLYSQGRQVPSEVYGLLDGRLDLSDGILFYSPPPKDPHTRVNSFLLGLAKTRRSMAYNAQQADPGAMEFGPVELVLEENKVYAPRATIQEEMLQESGQQDFWCWKRLLPAPQGGGSAGPASRLSFDLPSSPRPTRGSGGEMRLEVLGAFVDGVSQKIAVSINHRLAGTLAWTRGRDQSLLLPIPPGLLREDNNIQIQDLSPEARYREAGNELGQSRPNALYVKRVTIRFQALLAGPGEDHTQIIYHLRPDPREQVRAYHFTSLRRLGFRLYDAGRSTFFTAHTVRPEAGKVSTVICTTAGGYKSVASVARLRRTRAHLPGRGGSYVVITTARLKPFLSPLLKHRRAQGLTPVVVTTRELYDTFSKGAFGARAIKDFMQAAWHNWKTKPRFLLLVGDADRDVDWISRKETVPAAMVMTAYNGQTASDTPYGDMDGDGLAEVAVGRLPVRSPDVLIDLVERIIRLEDSPPAGPWRRRFCLVAGKARLGPAIDRLLAGALKQVLAESIPPAYRMTLVSGDPASPYSWPAPAFSQHVASMFNRGSLLFAYLGHGSSRSLDTVSRQGRHYPILDAREVKLLDAKERNPVLALLACWTGEYDRPDLDCLGELLLRQPGGPAAVIASSRISHPYPNALFGQALARAFFKGQGRLGSMVLEAKAAMFKKGQRSPWALLARPFLSSQVDAGKLVADHLYLYNLLGDPALRIPFASARVDLKAPQTIAAGSTLNVTGSVPAGLQGKLVLTLDRLRGRLPWKELPKLPRHSPKTPFLRMQRNQQANDPQLAKVSLALAGRGFKSSLVVPRGLSQGDYLIRAYLICNSGKDALGARKITILASDQH